MNHTTFGEDIVSRNPRLMNGALVFAGTRVPVDILMDHLAAGVSLDEFLIDFPGVSREQAVAYLGMARDAIEEGSALRRGEGSEAASETRADPL